jgi:hypothetical protein
MGTMNIDHSLHFNTSRVGEQLLVALARANSNGRFVPFAGRFVAALVLMLSFITDAPALIVGNVPNNVPNTTVNPAQYYADEDADPGWDNVVALGGNYVYLGDGWVLSARHVGYNATNGVRLQTYLPDGTPGEIKSFYRIPGTYYHDYGYGSTNVNTRQYAVSNPTTMQSETGQTISLAASNGTYFTDLQLFRISEDPGLPSLTIASQPLPSNFTRATAPEVVIIGRGQGRVAAETHWNVTGTSPNLVWTETTGAGTQQGYKRDGVTAKRFGTNRLTDIRPNFSGDPSDPGATNYTQSPNKLYEASDVVSDTTGVFALTTSDGVTRDIISMFTIFDKQTATGATALETQAAAGNSGSSVFYNRGGQWELVGIVHAISTYEDQPASTGVYGNATIISDLSYYNQNYLNSIRYIIDGHSNYSHMGDINLNGVLSGNGTGSWATDDVAAFVAGWGYDNGLGVGTITSWRNGDLNRDGKTDVLDFLQLRSALNGEISAAVVAALFGEGGDVLSPSGSVPEPSTGLLALLAAAFLALSARRRSRATSG